MTKHTSETLRYTENQSCLLLVNFPVGPHSCRALSPSSETSLCFLLLFGIFRLFCGMEFFFFLTRLYSSNYAFLYKLCAYSELYLHTNLVSWEKNFVQFVWFPRCADSVHWTLFLFCLFLMNNISL